LSQSVLVTRLTELFGAGLVANVADVSGGYELTEHGAGLARALAGVDTWSAGWARSRAALDEG
jgi:DNA-binding HxlR family transcriptional regulator